jgi:hypothetical protein
MYNKVKIGHEDVFIKHITDALNIPTKYHFDYIQHWVSNNSETKRVAIRKFKAYLMNITAFIEFTVNYANNTHVNTVITYSFIGNQPISDLFNSTIKFINDVMTTRYQAQIFGAIVRYNGHDYHDGTSSVIFYCDIPANINSMIEF